MPGEQVFADRHCRYRSESIRGIASRKATTFHVSSSVIDFRQLGMPVILIPFWTIQNSCGAVNFRVESSRYGGLGSIPPAHG